MLEILLFLPFLFSIIVIFLPKKAGKTIFIVSFVFSLFVFLYSLFLYFKFDSGSSAFQFEVFRTYIKPYINFHIGVDGISLFLVLLTTFIFPLSFLASYNYIKDKQKLFCFSMFVLEGAVIGVFISINVLLFYIFWELVLIPMYFIIGIWGGERRIYATFKFVLYTMAGSLLMLVGIIMFYVKMGANSSFELTDWMKVASFPFEVQILLFLAFTISFMIKVPMFPFHTWLPDAHTEAPTAGSVILAGVLLKMGTYGFLRFSIPLFKDGFSMFRPYLMFLAVFGIIYGGIMALIQKDMKRLVAYSSVSHMGTIMLGIFALSYEGIVGGIYHMLNHGLSTGALFLLVGFLYERTHSRLIKEHSGVSKLMPIYSAIFMIVMFSSVGLPGLNGFVGEFLVLFGTFKVNVWYAVSGATGIIIGAAYLLWMFRRVMQGKVKESLKGIKDLSLRELIVIIPIIILIFWMGIYPKTFISKMKKTVKDYRLNVVKADTGVKGR